MITSNFDRNSIVSLSYELELYMNLPENDEQIKSTEALVSCNMFDLIMINLNIMIVLVNE